MCAHATTRTATLKPVARRLGIALRRMHAEASGLPNRDETMKTTLALATALLLLTACGDRGQPDQSATIDTTAGAATEEPMPADPAVTDTTGATGTTTGTDMGTGTGTGTTGDTTGTGTGTGTDTGTGTGTGTDNTGTTGTDDTQTAPPTP